MMDACRASRDCRTGAGEPRRPSARLPPQPSCPGDSHPSPALPAAAEGAVFLLDYTDPLPYPAGPMLSLSLQILGVLFMIVVGWSWVLSLLFCVPDINQVWNRSRRAAMQGASAAAARGSVGAPPRPALLLPR
jgi:hypothetical protein